WFAVALFGANLGLIDRMTAFGTMTVGIGATAAMVVAGLAVIALIAALLVKPRQGWVAALVALIIPIVILAGFTQLRATAEAAPFIYDVTTDTADAPRYSAQMERMRDEDGANPLMDFNRPLGEYEKWAGNPDVADTTSARLIADGYPDLRPLSTNASVGNALKAVEAAMRAEGIENVTVDARAGTVEGTAVVFWYGFRDDVIARVRPAAGGSTVDFRSTSRVGTSDLGVNAARIMDLRKAVEQRIG
ncbi:MAG: DUF1499 domain-containing protein, partial [Pontixanthobacter sp.]